MSLVQHPRNDNRRCNLCDGNQFRLLHEWERDHPRNSAEIPLSVWQCRCGLAFLHPVPTAEQLPDHGEWSSAKRKSVKRRDGIKKIRNRVQNFVFGDQKVRFVRQTRRAISSGKMLDIGCGTGELLRRAQPWFECEGVEPSQTAAAVCARHGIAVTTGFFEKADLPAAAYDVVTMYAVLEHVHDPLDVLTKVNHVLRPGGVVAIKVPKLYGPAHRMHGREWNGFRLGYHTFLFTGASLGGVLNAAGFDVLKKPRRDRSLDDILILWGKKVRQPQSARITAAA